MGRSTPISWFRDARLWVLIGWVVLYMTACSSTPETRTDVFRGRMKEGVAVWNLLDLSPSGYKREGWGEVLSAGIIEVLASSEQYEIVEREKLILALEELSLGASDLVDEETRLQLGRIVGARLMIFGSYMRLDQSMRIDLRLVDVETGRILNTGGKTFISTGLPDALETVKVIAKTLIAAER